MRLPFFKIAPIRLCSTGGKPMPDERGKMRGDGRAAE
jgi:hypothetical protein